MADFKIQSSIQIDTAYVEAQLDALRAQFEAFRARLTQPSDAASPLTRQ